MSFVKKPVVSETLSQYCKVMRPKPMSNELKRHPHTKDDGSWWEYDAQNIPLCRVCDECRAAKLSGYRPEILTGYSQADVDEPIEPDGETLSQYCKVMRPKPGKDMNETKTIKAGERTQNPHGDPKHWTIAAYGGSVTTGEPKFYAIKSASDCVCSEIAEEETALFMLGACKSAGKAIELLKESRETIAACFRVISATSADPSRLEFELHRVGVPNGLGVRIQDFIANHS